MFGVCALKCCSRVIGVARGDGADKEDHSTKVMVVAMKIFPQESIERRSMENRKKGIDLVEVQHDQVVE